MVVEVTWVLSLPKMFHTCCLIKNVCKSPEAIFQTRVQARVYSYFNEERLSSLGGTRLKMVYITYENGTLNNWLAQTLSQNAWQMHLAFFMMGAVYFCCISSVVMSSQNGWNQANEQNHHGSVFFIRWMGGAFNEYYGLHLHELIIHNNHKYTQNQQSSKHCLLLNIQHTAIQCCLSRQIFQLQCQFGLLYLL